MPIARLTLCALIALPTLTLAQAPAAAKTEQSKWQVSMSILMGGMTMPAQTAEVCAGGGEHDAPPISSRKECEVYDSKRNGNTQSFKMRCSGQVSLEGSGAITYDNADHYRGKMDLGGVSMSCEGQRLGKCDGTEVNGAQTLSQAQSQVQSLQNDPRVQEALKKAQETLKNSGQQ